jgi:hypothetical protein
MTTLANFPMLNQLADTHEVNAAFDCVPTSIAACLEWLLKKPFDGGAIKDAVYGAGYKGATSAANYSKYCHEQGVTLAALNGTPAQLVADIRFWLGQEQPLLATEPDPYANASLGWTHVVAFYGADEPAGTLTCLDPYGGHPVTLSDTEWIARLQFKQVWKLERIEVMGTPAGWRDDGTVLYSPSHVQGGPEVPITGPFRDYVLGNAWRPADRAIEVGHHVDNLEESNTSLGSGWRQQFLYSLLEKPDAGAHAGQVLYGWIGVEVNVLRETIASLKAQLAVSHDPASVANRLTALAQLGHQIETVATQPL